MNLLRLCVGRYLTLFCIATLIAACTAPKEEEPPRYWPMDYDHPKYVAWDLLDFSKNDHTMIKPADADIPVAKYRVPAEFLRAVTRQSIEEFMSGHVRSTTIRGKFFFDGEKYLIGSQAIGELIDYVVTVSIIGTDDRYQERLKYNYPGDERPESKWRSSGDFQYGLEKLRYGFEDGTSEFDEAYVTHSPEFGIHVITCRAKLASDGSGDWSRSTCVLTFEHKPQEILRIGFPRSRISEWPRLQNDVLTLISEWRQ